MHDLLAPVLGNPLLTLFLLVGLGLLLGNIQISGISLGSSGVIFVALLAGHFGATMPGEVGKIGLVLFVYCVGIGAGGRFFGALKREGSQLARLAILIVVSGALTVWFLATVFGLDAAMATGIFAGAMTSTPALAAAMEGAKGLGDSVVVGYGVAYPFGVIGVVLFVQLLPRLLKRSIEEGLEDEEKNALKVERQLVEVTNPNLTGKRLAESSLNEIGGCQISRVWRDDRLQPLSYEDAFSLGQRLLLVGDPKSVKIGIELIGKADNRKLVLDADEERQSVVITNKSVAGKTVHEVDPLKNHGVVITRISRMDFTFAPKSDTRLEPNDILTVVGPKENLTFFGKFIGHAAQGFSETSLVSLAIGLALGILVGSFKFPLPGGTTFSLGLAGGPLIVALLLGHFGKLGAIVGHIPRPTRNLLQEMGLVFFLADAGVKGGATMVEAVAAQGAQIFLIGAIATIMPMAIGYLVARLVFKMKLAQALGGICGGMTSTPALGAITAKTNKQAPIVSYATVYPVSVILMAVCAKVLLQVIG